MPLTPAYRYRARCERVIDGDTYVLNVDLGFHTGVRIHGRLRGIDTPELRTAEGQRAKTFAMTLLPPYADLLVETYKDEQSFARWIVDVWLPDGQALADVLRAEGLEKPAT